MKLNHLNLTATDITAKTHLVRSMPKPYLIVVTGRPGSGKTTFSRELGNEIFMPIISRDQIKEGYVHTFGKRHHELPEDVNITATAIFFETLSGLITNHVSVIAEAAFQHKIWSSMLEQFMEKAQVYMLICKVDEKVALDRFVRRGLNNPLREYFHGDKEVDMARKGIELTVSTYEEPRINVPTFHVNTSGIYTPSIKELSSIFFDN
ncbi:AAA family ATPase [Paenibacillus sp. MMS20-IR301]|uniref:AAA family ATPase n=1 Tax=Paenibacillus sp. MMS20-IR301 TaxID=2895946 RepID=UPI0028E8D133|nr:AAA family ATPase [Paenibacillus sp. MMS20-IR301]WNS43085.1 AAA family ATPase [Paenibacillus sp. MMS20-IR301]